MSPHAKHEPGPTDLPEGRRFACHTARLLDDSKCENVRVMDLRGLSPMADYFVIATGTSERQLHAVADEVRELADLERQPAPTFEGERAGGWVIADFFDVVLHLFSHELRAFYDLESLWADSLEVDWRAVTKPGQFTKLLAQRKA